MAKKKKVNSCANCDGDHSTDKCPLVQKKSKSHSDTVARIDFVFTEVPQNSDEKRELEDFYNESFKPTAEGFLKGMAPVTNVGVFPYLQEDGSVRWELRPPEEVFSRESIDSLRMKPLTNNHPNFEVAPENVTQLQVGSLGDSVVADAYHLNAPIIINEQNAIKDAQNGKRSLSCGYFADIEEVPGVWMGVPYDAVQRNIRYNHVAIVDRGRAGDDVKIKLDSVDFGNIGVMTMDAAPENKKKLIGSNEPKEDEIMLKKIKIDGVEYEAEAEVIKTLSQVQAKLDEANEKLKAADTEKSTLNAKVDTLEEEKTDLQKKLDEAKNAQIDPVKIDAAVEARIELNKAVEKAGVEVKEDMCEIDIKKAVILSVSSNADATAKKLDGADDVYINARFDSAVEKLDEIEDVSERNTQAVNGGPKDPKKDAAEENKDSGASRKKMVQDMQNAWMKKEKN
jgi:hypothetical protein